MFTLDATILLDAIMQWVALLAWPAVSLSVGWCLWALLRPGKGAVPVGWLTLLGLGVSLWLGVLLAMAGAFWPWLLGALLLAPAVLVVGRAIVGAERVALPPIALPPRGRSLALVGALLTLAAVLLASPAESFVVTDDAGVYTLGAIHLAASGELPYDEPGIYPLRATAAGYEGDYQGYLLDYGRQFLLPENVSTPAGTRFWGPFFQPLLYRQRVEIGYLPTTKVLGAGLGLLLGARWVIWAGPAMALLSLALFIGLLRKSAGWRLALPAGAMLAFSFPQVWFGRHLLSEPVTQALVMAVLWLQAEADTAPDEAQRALLRAAEALLLGLLPLTRLEGAFIGGTLLGWLAWHAPARARAEGRIWVWRLAALGVGQGLAILASPAYLYSRSIGALSQGAQPLVGIACVALAGAGAVCAVAPLRRGAQKALAWLGEARHRAWLTAGLSGLLALIVLVQSLSGPPGRTFAGWLVQYWSLPALLFSLAGLLLAPLLCSEQQRAVGALASLGVTFALLYAANPQTTLVHPWVMRRAVPLVMPALALGAPLAAQHLIEGLRRGLLPRSPARLLRGVGYGALAGALVIAAGATTLPLTIHQERRDVWSQLAEIDALLEPRALLMLDDGDISRQIAQPLALIYGHTVYHLQQTEVLHAEAPPVARLLAAAREQGRPAYWLVSDVTRRFAPVDQALVPVGGVQVYTPVLAHRSDGPPNWRSLARQSFLVDVYAIVDEEPAPPAARWGAVPLGAGSYPYLMLGFYGYEQDALRALPYRWMAGRAVVRLPWPNQDDEAASFEVAATVAGLRPWRAPDPWIEVWAEGQRLLRTTVPANGEPVELRALSPALYDVGEAGLEITLLSDTYVPAEHGGGSDTRELGLRLYGLSVGYEEWPR